MSKESSVLVVSVGAGAGAVLISSGVERLVLILRDLGAVVSGTSHLPNTSSFYLTR